jgi:hypothetical protein
MDSHQGAIRELGSVDLELVSGGDGLMSCPCPMDAGFFGDVTAFLNSLSGNTGITMVNTAAGIRG